MNINEFCIFGVVCVHTHTHTHTEMQGTVPQYVMLMDDWIVQHNPPKIGCPYGAFKQLKDSSQNSVIYIFICTSSLSEIGSY